MSLVEKRSEGVPITETAWGELHMLARSNDIQIPFLEGAARCASPPEQIDAWLESSRRELNRFWSTVDEVRSLLLAQGLDPVFIKTLRSYPYCDSNLDILVPKESWPLIEAALVPAGFERATWRRDWGKFLLEPDKDWYHPPPGLTPVHVYPRISWHGMEFIPAAEILETAERRSFMGHEFVAPAWTQDLMIHCPHTVYENYGMRLGEFLHIATTLSIQRIDLDRLFEVADRGAWAGSVEFVLGLVKALHPTLMPWGRRLPDQVHALPEVEAWAREFPLEYPRSDLRRMWMDRSRYHLLRGRLNSAAKELWRHPAYKLYKRWARAAH